ncbi:MAG: efflux RND transporter periplasmic adaptor subunit [Candidatus Binataceae bacterium]
MFSSKSFRRTIVAVAIIALALVVYFFRRGGPQVSYITAAATRGSVVRTVVATGTVNPVTVVQVGTYVSGPITNLYVDFNSPVKAGQLMAKIDPRPFEDQVALAKAAVANAKAQLNKDQANLAYQKITYGRDLKLLKQRVISQDQVDSQRSTYMQAKAQTGLDQASIQQQSASLQNAEVQLGYTNIVSPVNGTVVSRNIDVGQTVAASFQTPTLFLIAKDLTRMQVDTNVSESDIGNVRDGQRAEFSVDAFPNRQFAGTVGQVRQAPITVQNVVTYDVVVDVANPELMLKPGMTADVTITTARRDNVLRIPLQAVRFSPEKPDGAVQLAPAVPDPSGQHRLWTEHDGKIDPVAVKLGLSDGNYVEVLSGNLAAGQQVVTNAVSNGGESGGDSSPFSPAHYHHH